MSGQRADGSRASARATTGRTARGSAPTSGVTLRIAPRSSSSVAPRNGRAPVSPSNSATANANWSAAGPTLPLANCSGAMYAGVPSSAPVRVSVDDRSTGCDREVVGVGVGGAAMVSSRPTGVAATGRGAVGGFTGNAGIVAASASLSKPRASPKSVTTTSPSRPSSTLAGLKSRWTRPRAWAAASPAPAARNRRSTSAGSRRSARSQSARLPPSSSSIATKSTPIAVPTS